MPRRPVAACRWRLPPSGPSKVASTSSVLDPCCGSGHFLVEGLELLVRLRMEEEGLGVEAAVRAVLQDNLRGLEIDPRCTQIAAFNLALSGVEDGRAPHRVAAASDRVLGSRPERGRNRSGYNWRMATSGSKVPSTGFTTSSARRLFSAR